MAKPTQEQIDDVLNKCAEAESEGESRYPAASYEQGVAAGIKWLTGEGENPLED